MHAQYTTTNPSNWWSEGSVDGVKDRTESPGGESSGWSDGREIRHKPRSEWGKMTELFLWLVVVDQSISCSEVNAPMFSKSIVKIVLKANVSNSIAIYVNSETALCPDLDGDVSSTSIYQQIASTETSIRANIQVGGK